MKRCIIYSDYIRFSVFLIARYFRDGGISWKLISMSRGALDKLCRNVSIAVPAVQIRRANDQAASGLVLCAPYLHSRHCDGFR